MVVGEGAGWMGRVGVVVVVVGEVDGVVVVVGGVGGSGCVMAWY